MAIMMEANLVMLEAKQLAAVEDPLVQGELHQLLLPLQPWQQHHQQQLELLGHWVGVLGLPFS
jgi:hypothetical protein